LVAIGYSGRSGTSLLQIEFSHIYTLIGLDCRLDMPFQIVQDPT